MYYGVKDRGRDQSSDGSDPPQLKEAGAVQVRYVLRERGVERDNLVKNPRRVCVGTRQGISQSVTESQV